MAHADTVNTALDVLYAADLDAFTSTRTELAQRVRDEAGKDAADAVARARKPTVPAWALNRVVRERAGRFPPPRPNGSSRRSLPQWLMRIRLTSCCTAG